MGTTEIFGTAKLRLIMNWSILKKHFGTTTKTWKRFLIKS
jgi:hypothetical protein